MPHRFCPICEQPGRLLDVARTGPFRQSVDYYRCDDCGHVWHHSKDKPDAPAVSVTKPSEGQPTPP